MSARDRAAALAERTSDAYSFDRYANWTACAAELLRMGYTEAQAEDILRSKIMRWAGDNSKNRYGRYTSRDMRRFIERNRDTIPGLLQWCARCVS